MSATKIEPKKEHLFDVKLFASFRVKAKSESEAERLLTEALDCATINAGAINGEPLIGEASVDGELDLIEEIDDETDR